MTALPQTWRSSFSLPNSRSRSCRRLSRVQDLANFGHRLVGRAFLISRPRGRGQLQHRCPLPLAQPREQHHLAVRKLQSVVVGDRIVQVDLPKARKALSDLLVRKNSYPERRLAFDIGVERDFGAGKQANRNVRTRPPLQTRA